MSKIVRDYAAIMYHDRATCRMLERDGDAEVETLSINKLAELSTYVPSPINENPFAREACMKAQGKNFTSHITMKLFKGVELRRILKNGKFGASNFYEFYGDEKTEQDVIDRMERNNPGRYWVKA